MTCPPSCPYPRVVVDRLEYTDLIAGRRLEKVRSVCTAGHSDWATVDLGPLVDHCPIVRYQHEEERARKRAMRMARR